LAGTSFGALMQRTRMNIHSSTNHILIKDIVKDTLWTTRPLESYGDGAVVGTVDVGRCA